MRSVQNDGVNLLFRSNTNSLYLWHKTDGLNERWLECFCEQSLQKETEQEETEQAFIIHVEM